MTSTLIQTRDLPVALRHVLGSYRKRTVRLYLVSDTHQESICSSAWDGGSRTFTSVFEVRDGRLCPAAIPARCRPEGWPSFRPGEKLPLAEEGLLRVVVETGVFLGKTATATLTVPASAAAQLGLEVAL